MTIRIQRAHTSSMIYLSDVTEGKSVASGEVSEWHLLHVVTTTCVQLVCNEPFLHLNSNVQHIVLDLFCMVYGMCIIP